MPNKWEVLKNLILSRDRENIFQNDLLASLNSHSIYLYIVSRKIDGADIVPINSPDLADAFISYRTRWF